MTLQKVAPEHTQSNSKQIIAGQIKHLRNLFTPKGLHRIAHTRNGIPYRVTSETLFALAESAPVQFSFYIISTLGGLWYEATESTEKRASLEETLVSLASEWIEKYCIGGKQ